MEHSNIKIHISAPMSLDMEFLYKVRRALNTKFVVPTDNITFWDRQSKYKESDLTKADVVIVLNPDMKFNTRGREVAPGVSKELCYAIDNCISIYMGYQKSDGDIEFYNCDVDGDSYIESISGIAGTTGINSDFYNLCKNRRTKSSSIVEDDLRSLGIDPQAEMDMAAHKLMTNSMYGSATIDSTKWEQIKFPKVKRVYAKTILNPDYSDERLLLML